MRLTETTKLKRRGARAAKQHANEVMDKLPNGTPRREMLGTWGTAYSSFKAGWNACANAASTRSAAK